MAFSSRLFMGYLIFASTSIGSLLAQDWSHDTVNDWPQLFPQFCSGRRQSPINLVDKIANRRKAGIKFVNFETRPVQMTWINDGHSAELTLSYADNIVPTIITPDTKQVYQVDALHYHWGPNNKVGSEHTMNGVSYPLEVHIVSFNRKYGSLQNAVPMPDGLLVVGTFFTIDTSSRSVPGDLLRSFLSLNFPKKTFRNDYMRFLPHIVNYGSSFTFVGRETISLSDIIRQGSLRNYFTYDGSLTTPNCAETVRWFVNRMPVLIRAEDMRLFRLLRDENGRQMTSNHRPVQPLNGRKIYLHHQ